MSPADAWCTFPGCTNGNPWHEHKRLTPNAVGITGWVLLIAGFLIGCNPPPLSGRTLLALLLITTGGVLLLTVTGRHNEGPRP